MTITDRLLALSEKEYAEFQAKLIPTIDKNVILGIRVPIIRKLAKELIKEKNEEIDVFLNTLPHKYYDENMLHGLLLSEIKDYDRCVALVDAFLPYVDNWAVCDIMSPKIFKKNKDRLIEKIEEWTSSQETYTCRFGLEMLMSHYLDDDFNKEYLEKPSSIRSDEYYLNMMLAWFFATALAKQWDATIPYIENHAFDKWVHNKTIQKARESYRISDEQKKYLKSLKI